MIVQKYLVAQGICSRREAEAFLRDGLIRVNGKKVSGKTEIGPNDVVTLNSAAEERLGAKTTVAIYKPRGIMCSYAEHEGTNVFDLFPQFKQLHLVGRLDKESEGLLLLSNDGLITKAVTNSTHDTEKEYEVEVQEYVSNEKLTPMEEGIMLHDGITLPAKVHATSKHSFRIILREGRNRQIRRMCSALDLSVLSLKRIRIGNVKLGRMRSGESRKLSSKEIAELKNFRAKAVDNSAYLD